MNRIERDSDMFSPPVDEGEEDDDEGTTVNVVPLEYYRPRIVQGVPTSGIQAAARKANWARQREAIKRRLAKKQGIQEAGLRLAVALGAPVLPPLVHPSVKKVTFLTTSDEQFEQLKKHRLPRFASTKLLAHRQRVRKLARGR